MTRETTRTDTPHARSLSDTLIRHSAASHTCRRHELEQSHTASAISCINHPLCVNKTQKQSSGPTEVLKKMARNAALVVPDGMAPAMPASDTALAWGLESL